MQLSLLTQGLESWGMEWLEFEVRKDAFPKRIDLAHILLELP